MTKKRPTPHERRAAQARHEQEHRLDPSTARRPWFQVVAWVLVIGLVIGGVGSAVLILLS